MNKNTKILVALIAACAVVYFVWVRKPWSTLKGELKDFAIADTGAVTKIFLAEKTGNKVLLSKLDDGTWLVDNTYKADPAKVNLLLSTMYNIKVRNPISEKEHNGIVKSMATKSIKTEFYTGDKLLKTIYVGSATADQSGTFMLIEGSTMPFVTNIQGFVGYLTPRFYPFPIKWRSKEIFTVDPKNIASIKVHYPAKPAQSFEVKNGIEVAVNGTANKQSITVNQGFAKYYLGSFTSLYFEGYDENIGKSETDSIIALQPFCIIQLTTTAGKVAKLTVFYKPVGDHTKQLYDEEGNTLPFDQEKYFGVLNNESNIGYIQQYTFGKIFKTLTDFAVGSN